MEGKALLVGSLFNFHGGKPSCMTGCLLLGNPNSRGGAKEALLKLFLESHRLVLGEQGKHRSVERGRKTKVSEMKRERICNNTAR